MRQFIAVAALALAISPALGGEALSELRALAGDAAPAMRMPAPSASPVRSGSSAPRVLRTTSTQWEKSFPLNRAAIEAAGRAVWSKAPERWSCELAPGAAAVRCDFAYNVWPEMCWYGYDHVVADLPLAGGAPRAVSQEWRGY